ncbi:MAG: GNAT family N-acetyltransferase, partial [Synechococcaceae cyanobacterium RL_1_2]|nr:GNAT family N-acetyltransferase [Synechococcaceae cyanobacterium RL_1_2]
MEFKIDDRVYLIRPWEPRDREATLTVIKTTLAEYGFAFNTEPGYGDWDAMHVEEAYLNKGGELWVVETQETAEIVGSIGFYPHPHHTVELRKMYLAQAVRHRGLGRYLLQQLEQRIKELGFEGIWIETITTLPEAIALYEKTGYQLCPDDPTEPRCDRLYFKSLQG